MALVPLNKSLDRSSLNDDDVPDVYEIVLHDEKQQSLVMYNALTNQINIYRKGQQQYENAIPSQQQRCCPLCNQPVYEFSNTDDVDSENVERNIIPSRNVNPDYFRLIQMAHLRDHAGHGLETMSISGNTDAPSNSSASSSSSNSETMGRNVIYAKDLSGNSHMDMSTSNLHKSPSVHFTTAAAAASETQSPSLKRNRVMFDDADDKTTYKSTKPSGASGESLSVLVFNQGYYSRFFTEKRKIGSGGFGGVFLCDHYLEGIALGTYAVKKIPVGDNHSWLVNTLAEVCTLERLHHPNIVHYKHAWVEKHKPSNFGPEVPCLFVLMEYANHGTLADLIWNKKINKDLTSSKQKQEQERWRSNNELHRGFLDEEGKYCIASVEIERMLLELCFGLQYLHRVGIVHRDLKPENILLHKNDNEIQPLNATNKINTYNDECHILISDFGESRRKDRTHVMEHSGQSNFTLLYCAPEVLHTSATFDERADLWSVGVILYTMMYKKTPFSDKPVDVPLDSVDSDAGVNELLHQIKAKRWKRENKSNTDCDSVNKNDDNDWRDSNFFPEYPTRPDHLKDICWRLLSFYPDSRPTLESVIEYLQRQQQQYQTRAYEDDEVEKKKHKSFHKNPFGSTSKESSSSSSTPNVSSIANAGGFSPLVTYQHNAAPVPLLLTPSSSTADGIYSSSALTVSRAPFISYENKQRQSPHVNSLVLPPVTSTRRHNSDTIAGFLMDTTIDGNLDDVDDMTLIMNERQEYMQPYQSTQIQKLNSSLARVNALALVSPRKPLLPREQELYTRLLQAEQTVNDLRQAYDKSQAEILALRTRIYYDSRK